MPKSALRSARMSSSGLRGGLCGDGGAERGDFGGDVGPDEERALVGMAVFSVEVHELDSGDGESGALDDLSLDSGVCVVLGFDRLGGFDFGDDPAGGLFAERVDGDEDIVFDEGGFEDGGGAFFDGTAGGFDGLLGIAVVELDERGAGGLLARALADTLAHVEAGLKGRVGDELGCAGLVDLPPELAVALKAGGEAGFGEAGQVLRGA